MTGQPFQFNFIKCDKEEIHFSSQIQGPSVAKIVVSKDLTVEPIGSDGLQTQLSKPPLVINIKSQANADRDLLVMFIQYMVKRKTTGELALKNTASDSNIRNTDYQRGTSIPDHSISQLKEPQGQPQNAYSLIKGQSQPFSNERVNPNIYQSQYIEHPSGLNSYGGAQRDRSPRLAATSSGYFLDNPQFVQNPTRTKQIVVETMQPNHLQYTSSKVTSNRVIPVPSQYTPDLERSTIGPAM